LTIWQATCHYSPLSAAKQFSVILRPESVGIGKRLIPISTRQTETNLHVHRAAKKTDTDVSHDKVGSTYVHAAKADIVEVVGAVVAGRVNGIGNVFRTGIIVASLSTALPGSVTVRPVPRNFPDHKRVGRTINNFRNVDLVIPANDALLCKSAMIAAGYSISRSRNGVGTFGALVSVVMNGERLLSAHGLKSGLGTLHRTARTLIQRDQDQPQLVIRVGVVINDGAIVDAGLLSRQLVYIVLQVKCLLFYVRQDENAPAQVLVKSRWQQVEVIVIVVKSKANLFQIVLAAHAVAGFTDSLNGWQQQSHQQADYRNNHQQFD